jgi:REP element-mobilizing transposase RayT
MKRVRITYEGAYHHAMNRGINGEEIFLGSKNKVQFLNYLEEFSKKLKIRILFYCIMDNHYHLVLENSNGKMSDFFRHLNGQYGMYYRKTNGETGYVFQTRYKSTLIQNDSYLKMAIGYGLLNPVRAKIVRDFNEYTWSSAKDYFSDEPAEIVDCHFVNGLFISKSELSNFLESILSRELPLIQTKYGEILGEKDFIETAVSKFDRREKYFGIGMKRTDDRFFEPVEKIIWEFEKKIGMKIEDLDVSSFSGKRLRSELLVRLRDLGGLRYSEITDISPFDNLKFSSLPRLYKDAKRRQENDKGENS